MTCGSLKDICRQHGLPTTGKKADLIARLDEFMVNGPMWNDAEINVNIPTFRKKSGPTFALGKSSSAVEYFDKLFTVEIIQHIVQETNRWVITMQRIF